jgi:hypothetical protein
MSIKDIQHLICQIFTQGGIQLNGFTVIGQNPIDIKVEQKFNYIQITFPNNKPKASIKKIIRLSANIESITLGEEYGSIKLQYFPEFKFQYEKSYAESEAYDVSDIKFSIDRKYRGKNKEIADLCLQYGQFWATIAHQNNLLYGANNSEKVELKKQCLAYVKENVAKDMSDRYGSAILTYVLVFIIIPIIARFVINKLLEKFF